MRGLSVHLRVVAVTFVSSSAQLAYGAESREHNIQVATRLSGGGVEDSSKPWSGLLRRLVGEDAMSAAESISLAIGMLQRNTEEKRRAPGILDLLLLRERELIAMEDEQVEGVLLKEADPENLVLKAWDYSAAAYGFAYLKALGMLDGVGPASFGEVRSLDAVAFKYRCGGSTLLRYEKSALGKVGGAPAYLIAKEDGVVVLAVRGTGDVADAVTDLACTAEPCGRDVRAHTGFLRAATAVLKDAAVPILNALDEPGKKTLLLTGHSLGGGVALLLALLLSPEHSETKEHEDPRRRELAEVFGKFAEEIRKRNVVIRCVAFSPPPVACMVSGGPVKLKGAWSYSVGDDLVPTLSIASVQALGRRIDKLDAELSPADRLKLLATLSTRRTSFIGQSLSRALRAAGGDYDANDDATLPSVLTEETEEVEDGNYALRIPGANFRLTRDGRACARLDPKLAPRIRVRDRAFLDHLPPTVQASLGAFFVDLEPPG